MNVLVAFYDALVSINVPADKAPSVVDAMERDMAAILTTKGDIELLRQDVDAVRSAAESDGELLRQDVEGVRLAAKADSQLLRASMTIRPGWMLVVAIGVLFTALTLTLHWAIR
jgi:hypothetical protein